MQSRLIGCLCHMLLFFKIILHFYVINNVKISLDFYLHCDKLHMVSSYANNIILEMTTLILTNPVVVSVAVMIVLCLFNMNIVLALLIAAMTAGLSAGMGLRDTMNTLISGMGGNSETALSYFLLGAFAVAISRTGLADIACRRIARVVKGRRFILIYLLVIIACMSQNLIPVHIAFIPILIPPLLALFNELKVDRRAVACALTFGLKARILPFRSDLASSSMA